MANNWHVNYYGLRAKTCAQFAAVISREVFGVEFKGIKENATADEVADYFKGILRNNVVKVEDPNEWRDGDYPVLSQPRNYHTGVIKRHKGRVYVMHGGNDLPPRFEPLDNMLGRYRLKGVYRFRKDGDALPKGTRAFNPNVDIADPVSAITGILAGIEAVFLAPLVTLGQLPGAIATATLGGTVGGTVSISGYFGALAGTTAAGFSTISGTLSLIGNLLGIGLAGGGIAAGIGALTPDIPGFGGGGRPDLTQSPTYNLGGGVNRARLESPMPLVMGTIRMNPDYVSYPFSQLTGDGNRQYWIGKLTPGFGDLDVSAGKVGNYPIDEFQVKQEANFKQTPLIAPLNTPTTSYETYTATARTQRAHATVENAFDYTYNSITIPVVSATSIVIEAPANVGLTASPENDDVVIPTNKKTTRTFATSTTGSDASITVDVTSASGAFTITPSEPYTGRITLTNYNTDNAVINVNYTGGIGLDAITNNVITFPGANLTSERDVALPPAKSQDIITPLTFNKAEFDIVGQLFSFAGANPAYRESSFRIWYSVDDGPPVYASEAWIENLPGGIRLDNPGTATATFVARNNNTEAFRRTITTRSNAIHGAKEKYTFFFQRVGAKISENDAPTNKDELQIPAMKIFIGDDAANYPPINIFTLLLNQTEQVNNNIENITYLVEAKCPVWDNAAQKWTDDANYDGALSAGNHKTSNPAAWFRNFAKGAFDDVSTTREELTEIARFNDGNDANSGEAAVVSSVTPKANPTEDTDNWSALTTSAWSATSAYAQNDYVVRNGNLYRARNAISAPSATTTYREIARWNDTSANYRNAGEADYTNFSGASICFNRNPLNNVADPFPLNASTTYRLRYVQGGSATQASAQIIGTPTQTHSDTSPGGGIWCGRFGTSDEMRAAFGNPVSNPNSPSSFNGGQWILEVETPANTPNSAPENDAANWQAITANEWSATSSYAINDVAVYESTNYRATAAIDIVYNLNNPQFCFNSTALSGVAGIVAGSQYRVSFIPGSASTSPAVSVKGVAERTQADANCFRFGSFASMYAAFGEAYNENVSDAKFNGGVWLVERVDNVTTTTRGRLLFGKGLTDEDLDLPVLQEWYEYCELYGLTFDAVIDTARTDEEVLQLLCRAGRAQVSRASGALGVVVFEPYPQTVSKLAEKDFIDGSFGYEPRIQRPATGLEYDYVDKAREYRRVAGRLEAPDLPTNVNKKFQRENYFGMVQRERVIEQAFIDLRRDYYGGAQRISFSVGLANFNLLVGDVVEITHPWFGVDKKFIIRSLQFRRENEIEMTAEPHDERIWAALGEFPILVEGSPILTRGNGMILYKPNEQAILPT